MLCDVFKFIENYNKYISNNPTINTSKLIKDFFLFVSFLSSGIKSDAEIYMNPPAAIGTSICAKLFIGKKNPTNPPKIAAIADKKLYPNALNFENPPCIRTPKSPISWGISCKITANVVVIPKEVFAIKLTAIIKPSMKLCTPPPNKLI